MYVQYDIVCYVYVMTLKARCSVLFCLFLILSRKGNVLYLRSSCLT